MPDCTLISIAVGPERERFLPLLLLADESEKQARSCMQRGDLYVFTDAAAGPVGLVPAFSKYCDERAERARRQRQIKNAGRLDRMNRMMR